MYLKKKTNYDLELTLIFGPSFENNYSNATNASHQNMEILCCSFHQILLSCQVGCGMLMDRCFQASLVSSGRYF